jgi:pyruvate formate lyase activating enzyme
MIKLSEKIKEKVLCKLCPNYCLLGFGEKGSCISRISDGEEITLNKYGVVSSMAVEKLNKKPITEFFKGSKTLSVGFTGCNLHCPFCENHKVSQQESENSHNKYYNICDIISLAKKYDCESICMTYNEPTISYEFLMNLAAEVHSNKLYFVLKTNGYINKEPWKEICQVTDAMNIDFKGSEDKYLSIIGAKEYVIRDRIKEAYNYGVHVEISIPLYYDDIEDEVGSIGEFLSSIDKKIPCHLLKIYSSYRHNKTTKDSDMEKAKIILGEYMNNITCH